ncbi:MAG: NAD(P)H-dependent glycerol-3-phosphate dehydrogenase [Chlorobium sp.]|uniref:NAD(P)H-dependent glycerol-3-phosphate dehydrogenase n=1 Tax=Chlorobium sp. TaxID=1095 RepID=UPI0025BC7286|nr:NAD(P)H-dependent glycerol-3-phosphate dehydrogenase [Chlorobium sp.]MCF8215564.1 NAD(P)H-dependent glycerol-3-phosphate dehydrogenase [Chlorobium sp.]MCF8270382.1 NAD(P)H-dependent glycerol-3-phosphate dehydrogenase [Chlorobium sp.]MCF8286751.1 NAD(P)H-dependent glycerol-3-phosphate dehydrogenase [Chlorobium sp.]MCF8290273.1 NAD(P)H-dependent glycerol-3-phosphate dehydrogenase [Chlorobium sp.]MCF8384432.1 NAD(P)H-dependent glycerol-3-phosphate dehydrogenase [Chlorobium sp.]
MTNLSEPLRIAVLGAGSWGTTLAVLLAKKGYSVALWAHRPEFARQLSSERENRRYLASVSFPDNLRVSESLLDAASSSSLIVTAVPSQALRETAEQLRDIVFEGKIIVNVAKGIELQTGKRMSEVLLETIPGLKPAQVAALYGPSHAEEVSKEQPTTVVASSPSQETARKVQEAFHTSMFRVYTNTDITGVEIAGSVKNIIAIAAGISDGIGYGDNAKAAIITRGLAEISRLCDRLGGDPVTVSGLSGIGDLVVTCLSRHSRNRYVGEEIGRGRSLDDVVSHMNMVAEGVHTSKAVYELSQKLGVEMPITQTVYQMLFEKKPVQQAILDLMTREPKDEVY